MRIGIAFDLKSDVARRAGEPDDIAEEYESAETIAGVAAALKLLGHEPFELGGGGRFARVLLERSEAGTIDLVFNNAEGRGSRSREAQVPALCEILGVPYTHSDPLALALSLDKAMTKRVALGHGIPTAPFCLVATLAELESAEVPPFPVVAKPDHEGSSMGIGRGSICRDARELSECVARLLRDYRQPVLVEAFLPGAEVTVGIVGSGAAASAIGAMEIAPRRPPFLYSLDVKRNYLEEVDYHVPPRLPRETMSAAERTALAAYRALGCRDVARVDIRLDAAGRPCLLEVNPLPGLDPVRGDLPILCSRLGIPYERLIATIVDGAIARANLSPAEEKHGLHRRA